MAGKASDPGGLERGFAWFTKTQMLQACQLLRGHQPTVQGLSIPCCCTSPKPFPCREPQVLKLSDVRGRTLHLDGSQTHGV